MFVIIITLSLKSDVFKLLIFIELHYFISNHS